MFVAYRVMTQRTAEIFDTWEEAFEWPKQLSFHGVKIISISILWDSSGGVASFCLATQGGSSASVCISRIVFMITVLQSQPQVPRRKSSCVLVIMLFFPSLSLACENWIPSCKAQRCRSSAPSVCAWRLSQGLEGNLMYAFYFAFGVYLLSFCCGYFLF